VRTREGCAWGGSVWVRVCGWECVGASVWVRVCGCECVGASVGCLRHGEPAFTVPGISVAWVPRGLRAMLRRRSTVGGEEQPAQRQGCAYDLALLRRRLRSAIQGAHLLLVLLVLPGEGRRLVCCGWPVALGAVLLRRIVRTGRPRERVRLTAGIRATHIPPGPRTCTLAVLFRARQRADERRVGLVHLKPAARLVVRVVRSVQPQVVSHLHVFAARATSNTDLHTRGEVGSCVSALRQQTEREREYQREDEAHRERLAAHR
jgi:hypothetical protein